MNMLDTPLEQLGASAHGHYTVAEKAAGKAEEHYKSAGIYLKHAKLRVLKTQGLTWPRWLADNCPIGKSRADEVIAISDGRMSPDAPAERHKAYREQKKETAETAARAANRPEKPNENNERQFEQQSPDPVKEAEEVYIVLMRDVMTIIRAMNSTQLEELKKHLR